MSYASDPSAYVHGLRRGQSQQQTGYAPATMNMYQQQQIQAALYQQQQLEFAQQQAQLEMHLQLEQMRLQNLALQEQIMVGQVRAHQQAQAQAQAEQLRGGYVARNAPAGARLNFSHSQGGIFAERALARRQQAEADALYARFHPNEQEEDDLLQDLPSHTQRGPADRGQSLTPPALVFSKPDEAFPVLAPSAAATITSATTSPKVTSKSHQHTDSDSSASTVGSLSSFTTRSLQNSECDNHEGESKPDKTTPPKKKFSEVVKASATKVAPAASKSSISVNTTVPPKLNPFSSVFVPGSASSTNSSPKQSAVEKSASSSPPATVTSSPAPASTASTPVASPPALLYRAVRSKSPPVGPSNTTRAPAGRSVSNSLPAVVMGAMPVRQPRGPAAEAELTNQNFATRIRKRAIKALGARPLPSPTPTQFQFHPQLFDNLMIQPQQQYLDMGETGIHSGMMSPGLTQLMAAARAREERFGY